MTCQWVKDPDNGLDAFIPRCWGGVHGPESCTCEIAGSELEQAQKATAEARETITFLREQLSRERENLIYLSQNNRRLRDEIRKLRGPPDRNQPARPAR